MAILCSHLLFIKGLRNTGKKENTKPTICRKWEKKVGEKQAQKRKKNKISIFLFVFSPKRWKATEPLPCMDMLSMRGWKDSSRTPLTELSPSVLSSSNLNYSCLRVRVPLTSMQGAQLRGTGVHQCAPCGLHPKERMLMQTSHITPVPAASCPPLASSQPIAWMPGYRCR